MLERIRRVVPIIGCLFSVAALAGPSAVWLTAGDGVEVRADLYRLDLPDEAGGKAPVILLFHQAGSNRAEYSDIAVRLNGLGFHALAIDQRSGGTRWGADNETVKKLGKSADYLEALPDLEAALKWKTSEGFTGKTLVWGSSYSASLVFLLAAEHREIDGVLSFSPGEYLGSKTDEVLNAAKKVTQPVLVLAPVNERGQAKRIAEAVAGSDARLVVPKVARHGSSMLVEERNPGADKIWPDVEAFLERIR